MKKAGFLVILVAFQSSAFAMQGNNPSASQESHVIQIGQNEGYSARVGQQSLNDAPPARPALSGLLDGFNSLSETLNRLAIGSILSSPQGAAGFFVASRAISDRRDKVLISDLQKMEEGVLASNTASEKAESAQR